MNHETQPTAPADPMSGTQDLVEIVSKPGGGFGWRLRNPKNGELYPPPHDVVSGHYSDAGALEQMLVGQKYRIFKPGAFATKEGIERLGEVTAAPRTVVRIHVEMVFDGHLGFAMGAMLRFIGLVLLRAGAKSEGMPMLEKLRNVTVSDDERGIVEKVGQD